MTPTAVLGPAASRLPRIWPWIVILVLGVAMVPTGIAIYVSKSVVALLNENHTASLTPVELTMRLGTGTYYVFADAAGPPLSTGDVTIRSSGAGQVTGITSSSSSIQSFDSNGTHYLGEISFDVVRAGVFSIHVASPLGLQERVFVAPSILSTLGRNVGWFGLSGAGGLLAILGLVLLIVRGVQRSRRRVPAPFAPRCANGHPSGPQDRFCHTCGAPVYAPASMVQQQ